MVPWPPFAPGGRGGRRVGVQSGRYCTDSQCDEALCLQGPSQLPPGFMPPQKRFPELARQEAVCRHKYRRCELSLKGWLYLKRISLLRPEIQLKATGTFSTASNSNRVGRLPRAEWGPRPWVPGNERRWCSCWWCSTRALDPRGVGRPAPAGYLSAPRCPMLAGCVPLILSIECRGGHLLVG